VARELEKLTGYPVFHNHLVVDMLEPVFEPGGAAFVEMRESIWLQVMARAARAGRPGLIFTFAPERTVRPGFVGQVVSEMEALRGKVLFVKLTCPDDVLEQRLGDEFRYKWNKLRSVGLYRHLRESGAFEFPPLPDSGLTIDTSVSTPPQSAQRIAAHFGLPAI